MRKFAHLAMAFAIALIVFLFAFPRVNAGQYLYEAGSTGATITVSTCTGCRVVNVKNIAGVTADDGVSDTGAINTYVQSNKTDIILFFPRGVYNWGGQLSLDGATNMAFVGEKGAIIRKNGTQNSGLVLDGSANDVSSGYSGEWIYQFTHATNLTVSGLRFEGLTTSTTDFDYGEQGIYCGSCNRWFVEGNEFVNFGDAATRSSTFVGEPVGTTNAKNTRIVGNYYYNIFQITTTPNDTPVNGVGRGGTENYIFESNFVDNLKGSVKYCCRHETHNGRISNNIINNQPSIDTSVGVELCSTSDVIVSNNIISNSGQWGVTHYINNGFNLNGWETNNLMIVNNIIHDAYRGIRMSNGTYDNGYNSPTGGIMISGNVLTNITGPNAAITTSNSYASGIVSNNVCKNIASGVCASVVGSLTNSNNVGI